MRRRSDWKWAAGLLLAWASASAQPSPAVRLRIRLQAGDRYLIETQVSVGERTATLRGRGLVIRLATGELGLHQQFVADGGAVPTAADQVVRSDGRALVDVGVATRADAFDALPLPDAEVRVGDAWDVVMDGAGAGPADVRVRGTLAALGGEGHERIALLRYAGTIRTVLPPDGSGRARVVVSQVRAERRVDLADGLTGGGRFALRSTLWIDGTPVTPLGESVITQRIARLNRR